MKRLILLGLLLLSCGIFFLSKFYNSSAQDSIQQAGYSLKGRIKGISGQQVVLAILAGEQPAYKDIDSVVMNGEEFTLEGKLDEPVFGTLRVHNADGSTKWLVQHFWIENRKIDVQADFTSKPTCLLKNAKLEELSKRYIDFWRPGTAWRKIMKEIQDCENTNNCTVGVELLLESQKAHTAEYNRIKKVVRNNNSSYYMLFGLSQGRLFLTPDELTELIGLLKYDIKQYPTGRNLLAYINYKQKIKIGAKLPTANAVDADGNKFPTDFSRAKITVIDCWASWCGPCREEFPELKRLYTQYHEKGLEIIGLAILDDPEYWKKAIQSHQLNWPNYLDVKNDSNSFSKVFCLDYIPQKIAVNSEGQIIAVNVGNHELEQLIRRSCEH